MKHQGHAGLSLPGCGAPVGSSTTTGPCEVHITTASAAADVLAAWASVSARAKGCAATVKQITSSRNVRNPAQRRGMWHASYIQARKAIARTPQSVEIARGKCGPAANGPLPIRLSQHLSSNPDTPPQALPGVCRTSCRRPIARVRADHEDCAPGHSERLRRGATEQLAADGMPCARRLAERLRATPRVSWFADRYWKCIHAPGFGSMLFYAGVLGLVTFECPTRASSCVSLSKCPFARPPAAPSERAIALHEWLRVHWLTGLGLSEHHAPTALWFWSESRGMSDVSIVLPCLNERQTLGECLLVARQALETIARRYGL